MKFTKVMKRVLLVNLLGLFFPGLISGIVFAAYPENAEVLPKGVSSVKVESNFFFTIDKRFNSDGKAEDIAADFNTSLNSDVFTSLRPLDPFVGGKASIGNSIVSSNFDIIETYTTYMYGITDRLAVGIMIPYWWVTNNVDARVDSSPGSGANVGLNPCFGVAGCPSTSPIIPLALGGVRLTTENVQGLLGSGLPGIPGFGYKRVETWSDNGLADIEAGFKYQYLKRENLRLAFTGGARFPTGKKDDPDNLMDLEFGSGAYALLFRLYNDYTGIKNLILDATFKYDLVLPDKENKRVPSNVNQPITTNKEEVKRDLGDKFQFEGSGRYSLLKGFDFFAIYNFRGKFKDEISGSNPSLNTDSLEAETRRIEHIYEIGFLYTTVPLYKEKSFPLPLTTSISYRDRFAGKNNPFDSQFISLVLQLFF